MTRWAMVVDLTRCIGCKSCISACSLANGVSEGLWRKLDELEAPQPPERQRLFATRSCMHCEEPPCKIVCPTGATFQRPDGIVEIDYEKCIGCGYCIVACPYDSRVIFRYHHCFKGDTRLIQSTERVANENREGVCTKCDFCVNRIESGLKKNLRPGIDPDATPLCVATCSCGALSFGDLDDLQGRISQMIKDRHTIRIFDQLETNPSVYYIFS